VTDTDDERKDRFAMAAETTQKARPQEAVDAAVEFVAMRPDGPARILARHYPTKNGICAGCSASATPYPCQAARIAEAAQKHPKFRSHEIPEPALLDPNRSTPRRLVSRDPPRRKFRRHKYKRLPPTPGR
jgi:hypothetical protein